MLAVHPEAQLREVESIDGRRSAFSHGLVQNRKLPGKHGRQLTIVHARPLWIEYPSLITIAA